MININETISLSRMSATKGLWLPFAPLRTGEGWYDSIVAKLKQVLVVTSSGTSNKSYLGFKPPELLHILRLQVPQYFDFITRVTFTAELSYDSKYPTNCCENTKNISWFSHSEFSTNQIKELWGPEPSVFVDALMSQQLERGTYTEYTMREVLKFSPRDQPKTYQEELLKSAGFQEKDIVKLFADFIQHCYPSQYMSYLSFNDYMTRFGTSLSNSDGVSQSLFRAFAFNRMNYLSFHEFLLGLAAMDKNTAHGGHAGELRCGYIFRYYNKSCNQSESSATFLDFDDMKI